jgi:hypothetical protein
MNGRGSPTDDRDLHDIPTKCPVTGGPLYVSELTSPLAGVKIQGKFRLPPTARLDKDQREFLEVFLRARGVISTMEKELSLSYPTVRARLDALLDAMGLTPYKESARPKSKTADERRQIIEDLEAGRITPEEAKARLREKAS